MSIALANTTTTDAYQDFAGTDVLASGWLVVANNPVLVKLVHGVRGQAIEGPEMFLPPGTYPMRSGGRPDPIAGVRFKSALAGTPAQVFGTFFYPGEATLEGGSPFDATVAASGAITGGGAGAMQLIQDQLLTVAAAEVVFANIPQTFAHLRLLLQCRGDTVAQETLFNAQFNSDGGANYDQEGLAIGGAASIPFEAVAQTSMRFGRLAAASAPAGSAGITAVDIPNYTGTTFHKQTASIGGDRNAVANATMEWNLNNWRSAAAINRIRIFPPGGNFITGSRLTLYGINV